MTVVGNTTEKGTADTVETGVVDTPAADPQVKQDAPAEKTKVLDDLDEPTKVPVGTDSEEVEDLSRLPGKTLNISANRANINGEQYDDDDLIVTPAEKSAYIDAIITGERYRQTRSLFGGKVQVTIRSRTSAETHAMYSYIRHILANKGKDESGLSRIEGDMAYIPLVAQIEELNGVKYPEMKGPLTFEESDGKLVEPGWFKDFVAWKNKPEGLTSALISEIQLFEYKYWTMTKEASNKNFWNSDTSTGA